MKHIIKSRAARKIYTFYGNVAKKDKWYYAYTIDGDTVTVVDACHAQNMREGKEPDNLK